MDSAYPTFPSHPPTSPSRQSKVISQRQYREREGGCISALRGVIKELTGEELQTRQEILRKAFDLLLSMLEARRQEQLQGVSSVPYDMLSPTNSADTAVAESLDYPHWPQTWQPHAELDEYGAQFNSHQYQVDPAFEQANFQGHEESWSRHPQP